MPIPTNNNINGNTLPTRVHIFSSAYMGNVRYYAAMLAAGGDVAIDADERIGKNAWMHNHCRIMGANGPQALTVPVEHIDAAGGIVMQDLRIAEHGDWRRVHWGALFSAYGKTPFFEYVADDLKAVYDSHHKWLIDFNMALHNVIVEFLDLPINTATWHSIDCNGAPIDDWRGKIGGKRPDSEKSIIDVPYYNIWNSRNGFAPALSIIDLLMNCGRESIFILLKMLNRILI